MIRRIAEEYKICLTETLTGFKYIGEQIRFLKTIQNENKKIQEYEYIFGFEESCGYLPGTYARDKDAVAAAMLLCEAAGYYKEELISIKMTGEEGEEKIRKYMEEKRREAKEQKEMGEEKKICGLKILNIRDYREEKHIYEDVLTKESLYKEEKRMPKANVIYYELEKESFVCIRPSGTEPKIKIYIGVRGEREEEAEEKIEEIKEKYEKELEELKKR